MGKLANDVKEVLQEIFPKKKKLLKRKNKESVFSLTLRDYFAAQSMEFVQKSGAASTPEELAEVCYYYADKMLEARKKK